MADDTQIKIAGYTLSGTQFLILLPVLSGLSGAIYFSYDAYQRFVGVESAYTEVTDAMSRIQALEQTVGDNDVANLSAQLTAISTNMETILEQQKTLLDLRSKVEKSETITNGLGDKLETYDREFDDLWSAMDELYENPLK